MEHDLARSPIWKGEDLGRPMPDSPHAVSVALPRWRDVVGYEEGDPDVVSRMTLGYPRFVVNPAVRQLVTRLTNNPSALPFVTERTASACAAFIRQRTGAPVSILPLAPLHVVSTTPEGWPALKAYWQHTGRILSSRQAQATLDDQPADQDGEAHRRELSRQVAALYDCPAEAVWLYPTGMAAIYAALLATRASRPGRRTLQLGFPYVDTLKLQEHFTGGVHFIPDRGGDLVAEAAQALAAEPFAACICEVPGNPLLGCIDIPRLAQLLKPYDVPLIVDDVVATPFNIGLSPHADIVVTSLTKYLAGSGNVMGGAVVLNHNSPHAEVLRHHLTEAFDAPLWGEDAALLSQQARHFPERMQVHNANGEFLAEKLRHHPAVEKVWYPKWEGADAYNGLRRKNGGWGGLLSFVLHDAARHTPGFYDRLRLCKGPTLGTVFTLVCPFTLLAHYKELDWAESCGVPRHLIRVAVGLEAPELLWSSFEAALPPT